MVKIVLPWRPLTKNNKYRRGRHGRIYLDPAYREWEDACVLWANIHHGNVFFPGRVRVKVDCYFSGRGRVGDEDNYLKSLGDILKLSGLIQDDRYIHWGEVNLLKGEPQRAEITIEKLEGINGQTP